MSQNPQLTVPKRAARTERRLKVLQLTQEGVPALEIADQLGVSHQTVYNDLNAALKELAEKQQRETAEWRSLEAERLDRLQNACWEKALEGHLPSVEAVLGIMGHRAKLLGLNQPVKVDLSAEVEHHVEQIVKILEDVLPPELFRKALEAIAA